MSDKKTIDVTNTPLIKIAYPLVIENLLFLAFNSVDIFMLSSYSDTAVAAVGLVTQYTWFIITFLQVIPNGATISLTNLLGGKKFDKAKFLSRTCLQMMIFFAIAIGLIFAVAVPQILKHYTLEDDVRQYATEYIFIYALFAVFTGISMIQSAILRSYGHTRTAMIINACANFVNIAGNAVALYGWFGLPVYGVKGVAFATVAAQAVGALILSLKVFSLSDTKYKFDKPFKLVSSEWKQILKIGVPTAGESVSWNLAQMAVMFLISFHGTASIAAFTYFGTILRFIYMIAISIGSAAQIKTGHFCGAGLQETAYKKLFIYIASGAAFSLSIAFIVYLFRRQMIGIFTSDYEIRYILLTIMPISFFLETGRAVNVIAIPSLMASGDIHFPVKAGIFSNWCISFGLAYVFSRILNWGFAGIIIAMACDECFRAIVMIFRWKSKVWMTKSAI
ncbi:MAG: MATE family efflux transporter [Treponema sp.]|nr:MATE family efflux transporter [Spirochaetia bacterium]MDD7458390.1 MATE family efflux transporter [Spirochaetales bacterium]MDY5812695.1 MATE family efflux transporter [Treponema sp.]